MQDPKSVSRLRQGDIATLKRLFKSNHSGLYALVFRLTQDREATDTVIRSAFSQLWSDRKELDPLEVIFLRLIRYGYVLSMEYRKKNDVVGLASGARTEAGEEIARRLSALPEENRLVYLLHIVDGYSIRELASAFDGTEASVRDVLGSALVLLDEEFDKELQTPLGQSSSDSLWQ